MTWQIFTTSFRLSLGIKVTLEGVWTGLAVSAMLHQQERPFH